MSVLNRGGQHGEPQHNQYQDLLMLTIGSSAAIYVWGYIGKMIETSIFGKFLSLVGRESLYIMAFHITGLFLCNSLLLKLGVFAFDDNKGLYTYDMGANWLLLLLYVSFGIFISLAIIYGFRSVRRLVVKI